MMGLPDGEKISDDMFTRFDRMYERDRQIHRQTDGHRMTAKAALDTSIARQKLCDPYLSALSVMYYNKGALCVHLPLSGCEKNCDFRPLFQFISKTIQDRTTVTMECEQESVPKLLNGTILND